MLIVKEMHLGGGVVVVFFHEPTVAACTHLFLDED